MRQHGFYKTGSFVLLLWGFILLAGVYNVKVIASSKEKPQRSTLPKFLSPENVTLEQALYLLELPK